MKFLLLVFVSLIAVFQGFGQGKFEFEKMNHDFGIVSEGEQAKFEFKFTNVGNEPIVLSTVKASCGCTTPFYTKEPVMPGETGAIKVSYNSKGRLGGFNKSITIHSNVGNSPVVYIKGIVEPSEEVKEYSVKELSESPILKVEKEVITMGVLEKGNQTKGSFRVTNDGKTDLLINELKSACRCIKVEEVPRTIKSGKSSEFTFTYTPSGLGALEDVLLIFSNDLNMKYKAITLISDSKETLTPGNMLKSNTSSGF